MTNRMTDKVALITGCSTKGDGLGNGKAIAVLLGREGAAVFGCGLRESALLDTKRRVEAESGICETMVADVSKAVDVERLVTTCIQTFGRIDVLVNNVGVSSNSGGPVECTEEAWNMELAVNLKSAFLACKYVIPHMERQGGGSIINIGSLSGIRGISTPILTYETSKAGLLGLSRSIALQYANKGIRSNVIIVGVIDTPTLQVGRGKEDKAAWDRACPMGHMGEPWDVAEAVLYLAADSGKYVTGTELVVDGGISARMAYSPDNS